MTKCPCKDCICKPICRHKPYFAVANCELLAPLFAMRFNSDPEKAAHIVQKQILVENLNPTEWSVSEDGWIDSGCFILHTGD